MPTRQLHREADGALVCARCVVADTPLARLRGLLGRPSLDDDEGLLLVPAASVHMLGMRFPIDAVFLDRSLVVLRVRPGLPPGLRGFATCRGAKRVLELPAGRAGAVGLRAGDVLRVSPDEP